MRRRLREFPVLFQVVTKQSAKFKTAQLRKIAALFEPPEGAADGAIRVLPPLDQTRPEEAEAEEEVSRRFSPVGGLYAGFGNRAKDATAYIGAGIAASRIFIINDRSSIVRWAQPEAAPQTAPAAQPAAAARAAATTEAAARATAARAAATKEAPLPLVAMAAEAVEAGGAGGVEPEVCRTWQGYGGMQGSLEAEFPLRCESIYIYIYIYICIYIYIYIYIYM